jgi:hypothetical protein
MQWSPSPGLRLARVAVMLALGGGGTAACGPSFQAVYEGDVHFEHCYALDEDPRAAQPPKKECWREWLHGYTYGQSRDRVEYAAARYSELSLDATLPTEEQQRPGPSGPPGSPRQATRPRTVAAPAPTSAFAPPPTMLEVDRDKGDKPDKPQPPTAATHATEAFSTPAQLVARAPGADCADRCTSLWLDCKKGCTDGTCDSCDRNYKTCVPVCFKDESKKK